MTSGAAEPRITAVLLAVDGGSLRHTA